MFPILPLDCGLKSGAFMGMPENMKEHIFLCLIFSGLLFSCNKTSEIKTPIKEDIVPITDIQPQTPGLTTKDRKYNIETISNDYIGVFLPEEYINSLIKTKNHSLSLHLKNKTHDVLAVKENAIYSNLKWHDQYAIEATEGELFEFNKKEDETIIIDNNGYLYNKIGSDPNNYYRIAKTFTAEIVLSELIKQRTVKILPNGRVLIPFLYSYTDEDTFSINLDDMFFEKGLNLLLTTDDRDNHFYMGIVIDGSDYYFYRLKRDSGDVYERSDIIYCYNLKDDKNILISLSGLDDNNDSLYIEYIDQLTEYEKRIIVNTMFALHGYKFLSEEWQSFFVRYSWYEPNNKIKNDPNTLNIRQRRLLEYLNQGTSKNPS